MQSMGLTSDDCYTQAEEQDREDDLAGAEETGLLDGDVVITVVVLFG